MIPERGCCSNSQPSMFKKSARASLELAKPCQTYILTPRCNLKWHKINYGRMPTSICKPELALNALYTGLGLGPTSIWTPKPNLKWRQMHYILHLVASKFHLDTASQHQVARNKIIMYCAWTPANLHFDLANPPPGRSKYLMVRTEGPPANLPAAPIQPFS